MLAYVTNDQAEMIKHFTGHVILLLTFYELYIYLMATKKNNLYLNILQRFKFFFQEYIFKKNQE